MKKSLSALVLSGVILAQPVTSAIASPLSWTARTTDEVVASVMESIDTQTTYKVQWGDTLSSIAHALNMSVIEIAALNNIDNPDLIIAGSVLSFDKLSHVVTVNNEVSYSTYTGQEVDFVAVEDSTVTNEAMSVKESEVMPETEDINHEAIEILPTTSETISEELSTLEVPMTTTSEVSTEAPMTTTSEVSTEAPMTTTSEVSTEAPMTTTSEVSTEAPMTTTTEVFTEAPTTTTTEATTEAPMTTTAEVFTEAPTTTTTEATTEAPTTTTSEVSTEAPTTTTTEATTEAPTTTEAVPTQSSVAENSNNMSSYQAFELIVSDKGLGQEEKDMWAQIINRESGWNTTISNSYSGAYGLPQALPGNKMSSHGSDWATNPYTQLAWMYDYMVGRYGSITAAYQHSKNVGWY